jgi:DNA-directed RNA polymerase I subunit RPA2
MFVPFQAIRPLEFMFKNDRISLAFVEATIFKPVVGKGSICRDLRVFPAECRGRRCSYRGKLVVSLPANPTPVPYGLYCI